MYRRFLAVLLAAVMAFSLTLPAFALEGEHGRYDTPPEYNDNDYQKMVAFLETEDANGFANRDLLSMYDFDPEDPETWTGDMGAYIEWIPDGSEYRIGCIWFDEADLVGALDLSGCEMLEEIHMNRGRLSSIDLTGTDIGFGHITAQGCGGLAFTHTEVNEEDCFFFCGAAVASPGFSAAFKGWFTASGEYVTSDLELPSAFSPSPDLVARFTEEGEEFFYNAADLAKIRSFFAIEDENGETNGSKISYVFDINDPGTWAGVSWRFDSGELFLRVLNIYGCDLVGELDLHDCPWLEKVNCRNNRITGLNVSWCSELQSVNCGHNDIAQIDLTGCSSVRELSCSYNALAELDVSDCPLLREIMCEHNPITELDFSENPLIGPGTIRAEGSGHVGIYYIGAPLWVYCAEAYPVDGAAFLGWYTESGTFITADACLDGFGSVYSNVVARFEGAIPGDADGDGEITPLDALIVLRQAMQLIQLPESTLASCDLDGSGTVDALDALMILRMAMGLI